MVDDSLPHDVNMDSRETQSLHFEQDTTLKPQEVSQVDALVDEGDVDSHAEAQIFPEVPEVICETEDMEGNPDENLGKETEGIPEKIPDQLDIKTPDKTEEIPQATKQKKPPTRPSFEDKEKPTPVA